MSLNGETRYRSITHTERFTAELAVIQPDARRPDEFIEGVEWVLARRPEEGIQVAANSPVWCIPMSESVRSTGLLIYYTFSEDRVWLLSIGFVEIPF